ncbi:hypothetical protein CNY89_19380 [Amaricoccus sp. HAR-UPW-R2A-40]|nr:hypothetical protein CNY89_19380 [Amaricoccus sp. HAR-UPW-R2A-40]
MSPRPPRRPGTRSRPSTRTGAGNTPRIAQAWRRAWQEVIPFFAFSPEIRRVIYTTNAIESLNRIIRKAIKTRGSFPSEDAAENADLPGNPGSRKNAHVEGFLKQLLLGLACLGMEERKVAGIRWREVCSD